MKQRHNEELKLEGYCLCGAQFKVTAPRHAAEMVERLFWEHHYAPGHGPTDARTCLRNRRKAEASELHGEES